jgi:transcriptional regulator with XRE-family HTH domain
MHTDEEINVDDFLRDLAARLAELRRLKGYSQDRLALEAGLTRGAISKLEKGDVDPRISTLAKIAHTLGVSLPHLVAV